VIDAGKKHWTEALERLEACPEAINWARRHDTTFEEAWRECKRGDWMLWLAGKLCGGPHSKSRKVLIGAMCECARTTWKRMPKEGQEAVRTTERWLIGDATLRQVRTAADAAYVAAYAAADAAAYVAYIVACVVADADTDTVYIASYVVTGKQAAKCAHIVRKHYPNPPKLKEAK